jgi:hypothetical protein
MELSVWTARVSAGSDFAKISVEIYLSSIFSV